VQRFAKDFFVNRVSKIVKHAQGKRRVIIFYPYRSPDPQGAQYGEYCMYALAIHKPWVGDRSSAWGGEVNPTNDHLIRKWQEHCEELAVNGRPIPDSFNRRVRALARERADDADAAEPSNRLDFDDAGLDEWMEIARRHFVHNLDEGSVTTHVFCDPAHRWPI
jgi:hypothetical protein